MGVDISDELRELLADSGLTHSQLAKKVGMERTDITAFANGKPIGKLRHARIAKAFGLTPADIPGRTPGQPAPPSLSDRLESLEEKVSRLLRDTTEGFAAVSERLAKIEQLLDPPTAETSSRRSTTA